MIHRGGSPLRGFVSRRTPTRLPRSKPCWTPARVCEGERVVVMMDAAHTQRDAADYLAGNRGFDYVMTVKGNQPMLYQTIFGTARPLVTATPHHAVVERGHGRINQWWTWVTDATGIDFPHAQKIDCFR